MAQGFQPGSPAALAYLAQLLVQRRVEPAAARSVFNVEGASGGIGDQGHAFGPGQENDAGGVLTGRFPGRNPQQLNAWAWSQAGLADLANRVAAVAAGQHGAQAVRSIVTRFERPKDAAGEIERALAGYGGRAGSSGALYPPQSGPGPAAPTHAAAPGPAPDPMARRDALLALMQSVGQPSTGNLSSFLDALRVARQPAPATSIASAGIRPLPAAAGAAPPVAPFPNPPAGSHGGIAELLQEGTGGPTHSTGPHVHAAFTNPQLELAAIRRAEQLGLHVGENPYVGSLSPSVHASHSYHKIDFPGLYNGRKLGEAIDVSGPGMAAFYKWLAGLRR